MYVHKSTLTAGRGGERGSRPRRAASGAHSVFDVAQLRLYTVTIHEFDAALRAPELTLALKADPLLATFFVRIIDVRGPAPPKRGGLACTGAAQL